MTKFVRGIFISFLLVLSIGLNAQKKEPKFGDVKPADFASSVYSIDSSANAVVLFDIGSSKYEGDALGGLSVVYKRHRKVRLLNKNAFNLATINLQLYASATTEEKIDNIEACTYTLENGKVQVYKLDKASIFKDKIAKNWVSRKFTMPNLQEGCIIEISYTLRSPNERYLRPWPFQGSNPVLWSEYQVTIPAYYIFVVNANPRNTYEIDDASQGNESYYITDPGSTATERSETFAVRTNTNIHKWAMKNVAALKEENYTTTMDNHILKIDFQLSRITYPNSPPKDIMRDWFAVSKDLMADEFFGADLSKNNNWMHTDLDAIAKSTSDSLAVAKKIFEYFRDNFTCTDHDSKWLSVPLKKVYQNKNGNDADINLLLTAALVSQGFEAKPVLLSTRSNGKANTIYPIMSQMNYVICHLVLNKKVYNLDATYPRLGFGHLNNECHNGYARLIDNSVPSVINLSADSLMEYTVTNAFFINDPKDGFSGSVQTRFGDMQSFDIRERLAKTSKETFFKELRKEFDSDVKISGEDIENAKSYSEPIVVKYEMAFEMGDDIVYMNPIFGERYKENPFKAATRQYPIEMPYLVNENYILRMDIPKGYKVEEMPKSARVNLNDDEGFFEYFVAKDENVIQLRSTIKLKKATYATDDYETLRNFFAYIVKKHGEQIVFKKIK